MNLHGRHLRPILCGLIVGLLVIAMLSPASGQTYLNVHVTNISISGELSARGLTAAFPHPILATISVTDHNDDPVLGLASTSRWLAPNDRADAGAPVAELWKRVLEYHRDERTFPPNPNAYDQAPAPLFTEFRKTTPFPTSTMLVMDISGSMIEELQDAKNGALAYLDELRPVDRAGIIQFCSFINDSIGFTGDQASLRKTIAETDTCSGTAIYDALLAAIQQTKLEKTRRAIVLYTDGYDNASRATEKTVIDSAKAYSIPIHTIALGASAFPDPLLNIATQTGGRFFLTDNSPKFPAIYKLLAALTQNFYMLAYSSPDPFRNGTWRTLDVTVCDTRQRQGSATGEYFVAGRSQPRATDLAAALTSFTDLMVFENGKAFKAVQPADRYTYRLGVKNLGAEGAESIRLTHHLPPSVSFLDATPTPFYLNGDSLLWQIARLDAGAADSITVTAQFAANAPPSLQRLISRLRVSARQDNNPGNNAARDTVRAVFAPPPGAQKTDLAVKQFTKTDSFAVRGGDTLRFVASGGTIRYRLTVANPSSVTAQNVRVTNFPPDSARAGGLQPAPASSNADSIVWINPNLPPQSQRFFNFSAAVSPNMPPGTNLLINTATARADNEDPATLGDNTAIDTVYNIVRPLSQQTTLGLNLVSQTDTSVVENGRVVNATTPGSLYEYRINLSNLGPVRADAPRVRQILPDSVRYVSASLTPSLISGDSLVWQIPQLGAGNLNSITVTVQLATQVPPALTNLISRVDFSVDNAAPRSATDTVRVVLPPLPPLTFADLAVAQFVKTDSFRIVGNDTVYFAKSGETILYQILVTNKGGITARNVRVTDFLPDSVRANDFQPPPAAVHADSLLWIIPALSPRADTSFFFYATVSSNMPVGTNLLINKAVATADNDDPTKLADNTSVDTVYNVVEPPPTTDLALTFNSRTISTIVENGRLVNAVKPGEPIDYKIHVRNLGLENASSILVRQLLPDSVRFVGASKALTATSNDSLVWQIPQLNSGGADSITVTVQFASQVPVTLTRLISRADLFSVNDNSPANNSASDTIRVVFPPPPATDLALSLNSRTISTIVESGRLVNAVKPGEPIDYKIRVRNLGMENAGDIRVRQLLPDSVRFIGASKTLAVTSKDSLVWQIPQLNAGGADSITVTVQFASQVPATLTRLISRADLFSPNDNSPANNSASDTIRVVFPPPPATDLALSLNSRTISTIVENGRLVNAVKPGEPIDYKIRVRNLSLENASSIRVRQLLPDSVRFIGASKALAVTSKDSLVWQIPQLNAGGADSITVTVQFASQVPATLTRLISRADLFSANDNTPGNNSASDTIRVVFPPPPATDLALSLNSRTISTIVENGRLLNAVKPGEPIDYKIRVRNLGMENAGDIRVRQLLPDSVRFIGASKALAVTSKDSLVWQIPQLNAGDADSITVTVQFASQVPATLTRLISRADLFSPNDNSPGNNSASDTIRVVFPPPPATDLALSLNSRTISTIVESGRLVNAVKPGEPIDYKIRVRNLGLENASSIRVRQLLPDSVRFIGASKTLAVTSRDSLVWQIPQLTAGGADSITVTVQFASQVPVTLTRLISRADLFSPNDNSPANNSASDTIRVVFPPPPTTDLALTLNSRTISTIVESGRIVNAVKPGEPIDYKIRVRNLGLENASSILVRQLLPDSVRFIGASKTLAVTNKDSLVWQIPQLNSGGADSITVTVQFASQVPATLTRLISRADLFSPNDNSPANNSASDTVRVVIPPPPTTDLALSLNSRTNTRIVENGRLINAVKPGEPIDYRIRVRNLGLQPASSIRVRQLLPDSVRFIGASKALAVVSKDSLVWQIPQLTAGGADSIIVTVQFASQVPATLTRLISRADLFSANDNAPANNSASDTIRVVLPPPLGPTDLAVTLASKTDIILFENGRNVNAVKPGQRYEYRLKVRNLGPERAENVRLRQSLPDSVHFISASKAPAVATRDSLVWQLAALNAGGSDSINVMVQFAPKVPQNLDRLISRLTLFAANDNSPANNVARDTVRVVVPPPAGTRPLIEARPPEVAVGENVRVRVQVLAPTVSWDLWVYFANNQIDSSYADAYIKATRLSPNVWHDVTPVFTNTRLFTAAKEEEIRFEIRSRDIFGDFATASASVLVRSNNDMVLDRNVFEAENQSPLGINFKLSSNRVARLDVYDLNGVCIAKLAEGPFNAGWNTYHWNGLTEDGRKVGSGVYIIALRSGEFTAWKKCIIAR